MFALATVAAMEKEIEVGDSTAAEETGKNSAVAAGWENAASRVPAVAEKARKKCCRGRSRHGLEVADEGLLKDLVVIFVFLGVLCTIHYFF
jgi:hypothetical protein